MLMALNLYGFMCEFHDDYKDVRLHKHIVYLQDDRVHKKSKYFKTIDYVKKLPFKFYKKSNRAFDNTGLMYVTYACRKTTRQTLIDYHKKSGCFKTVLVVPYKLPEYDNIDGII